MIQSDRDIKKLIKSEDLVIIPLKDDQIQSASVDLTLGEGFKRLHSKSLRLDQKNEAKYIEYDGVAHLAPKQFILATTLEYIRLTHFLCAKVEGKSSIGRIGLFIQNAGWIDPGFEGQITLELYNASEATIALTPGVPICQIIIDELSSPSENPYNGKYMNQVGVTESRFNLSNERMIND